MTEEVQQAIEELKLAYGDGNVEATPDNEGGAYVVVNDLDLCDKYEPVKTFCGFRITHMYPEAQVYPHFIVPDLKRADKNPLGAGFSKPMQWNDREVIQVSRKSNHWNPAVDTAQIKLEKVLKWIREQ
jgi:hypothetical protein